MSETFEEGDLTGRTIRQLTTGNTAFVACVSAVVPGVAESKANPEFATIGTAVMDCEAGGRTQLIWWTDTK